MTINELLAAAGLTGNDVIPMYDAEAAVGTEPTQKMKASDFAAAIKTLASLLSTSDVVNNLSSTSTTAPLSAAQGKALNDTITQSTALITTGSLHDLAGRNGIFWLTSGVTNKPETGGGMLLLRSYNNAYCCGLYTVADNGKTFSVSLVNGAWTYRLLAFA